MKEKAALIAKSGTCRALSVFLRTLEALAHSGTMAARRGM